MAEDIIHVVERAYEVTGSEQDWLQSLATAAQPILDRGLGIMAFVYQARAGAGLQIPTAAGAGMTEGLYGTIIPFNLATPHELVEATYLRRSGCATASEASRMGARLEEHPLWRNILHPHGMHDYCATNVLVDPSGRGCIVGAPLPSVARTPPTVRRAWTRVAAHIAAGLRLRDQLTSPNPMQGAEAILSPSGRVEHAEADAREADARTRLRQAALNIDRARSRLRRDDPDQALELWRALVSGRWSLLEHFERDGRRYLVARRNEPGVTDPRALSQRERQVTWCAALGHPNKLIGYELGLSLSSVASHLAAASRKLGVSSRAELVSLVRGILASPSAAG